MVLCFLRLCTSQVKNKFIVNVNRHISKTSSIQNVAILQSNENFTFSSDSRYITTTTIGSSLPAPNGFFSSRDYAHDFMAVFPEIVESLTEDKRNKETNSWIKKVIEYTVPNGKNNIAEKLIEAYKILDKPENLTKENMKLAFILGWCCEMFHASFLVSNDIIDGTETRRGIPCWYKVEDVGLSAFLDALMVKTCIHAILKKYFNVHPNYIPIMELIQDIALKTAKGQCLYIHSHHQGRPNLDLFTMERYNLIAKRKSYYNLYMPVAMAMYLADITNSELHKEAEDILLKMGHFFQVKDDYWDCYGDPKLIGKYLRDIQKGTFSWLAVMALERSSPKQREIFKRCFGKDDTESMKTIKDLYDQLDLPNAYAACKKESYNLLNYEIQHMSGALLHKIFLQILHIIYDKHMPAIL